MTLEEFKKEASAQFVRKTPSDYRESYIFIFHLYHPNIEGVYQFDLTVTDEYASEATSMEYMKQVLIEKFYNNHNQSKIRNK